MDMHIEGMEEPCFQLQVTEEVNKIELLNQELCYATFFGAKNIAGDSFGRTTT